MQPALRWLGDNLRTLILAFILAIAVWISAVVAADPNEQDTLRPVPLAVIGQAPDTVLVTDIPGQVRVTLKAPKSIWDQLNSNPNLVRAWIDVTGLEAGEHSLEVKTQVDISPIRFIRVEPSEIRLQIEPLVRRDLPVELVINGELPLGYRAGTPEMQPDQVSLSGPESLVSRAARAIAVINLAGAVETIQEKVDVQILDENDLPIQGINTLPEQVEVTQPISLLGRFKNVAVKIVTTDQVPNGYRLTNISVSPPTVTIFSDNPDLINDTPGYVETLPVDLSGMVDDTTISVALNLPEGITTVREPNVLVQVSVAAIEGSLTLTLPVEPIGLSPDLQAALSPEIVDVIFAGPLNLLEELSVSDIRLVLDLTGLPPGVYQREPVVEQTPAQVRVQTTLPETVEATIELAPTPTITSTASTNTALTPVAPIPTLTP